MGIWGVLRLMTYNPLLTRFLPVADLLVLLLAMFYLGSVESDKDVLFSLYAPELIVLGCGAAQAFPPAATLAACLRRGVGLESMTNAAAARTFNVLAGEGRRVVAGFVLGA